MKFLIVDESREFRSTLAGMLRERWPEAQTEEWDPRERGNPHAALLHERYDAVLLDTEPAGEDGLAWVTDIRRAPDAPPVVLLTGAGGDSLAVRAMKAGAADFLRKAGLASERLARALEDALREQEARRAEVAGAPPAFQRTVQLDVRKIGVPLNYDDRPIPGYRSLRKIGEGGMAQVYLAEREKDGLQLVLKVLDPNLREDQIFLRRFQQEYRLVSGVQDEFVAHIYDHGFAGERPYIAMEYLSGGTLAARMQGGLSSLAALRICSQIARALDAIHSHGIVHRDLKPQNILFRENGRPVIVDFGLAKSVGAKSTFTRFGEVIATPRYMSPEQCMGKPVDERSDLYSLGCILYEMLTGSKIYDSATAADVIGMHVKAPVPKLAVLLADHQPLLDKLLAKSPEDRYQNATEVLTEIGA